MPASVPLDAPDLLIFGASVRAAAQSALRAGFRVWGTDLFADADLCAIAQAKSMARYPAGFLREISAAPQVPWMYTGALENYPALISQLAKHRPLWGNSADVVRRARNPLELSKHLPSAGVAFPRTYLAGSYAYPSTAQLAQLSGEESSSGWLLKPKRSGGGSKVIRYKEGMLIAPGEHWYLQQYIEGEPCSAVFVAAAGQATLLGVTRQLQGIDWLHTTGFTYTGSVGPMVLSGQQVAELQHMGSTLAETFGLTGLFGVDLVQLSDDHIQGTSSKFVVIEINPRYTASIEVIERSLGISSIAWHVAACTQGVLPMAHECPDTTNPVVHAKGILFARQVTSFHASIADYVRQQNSDGLSPLVADIPHVGTPIPSGAPIVTLFANGSNEQGALDALRRAVTQFETRFYQS